MVMLIGACMHKGTLTHLRYFTNYLANDITMKMKCYLNMSIFIHDASAAKKQTNKSSLKCSHFYALINNN